jgi:hypothetical protein
MSNDDPNEREPFPRAQLYFYVIGTVVAGPLAKSGWDGLMAGDTFRGALALSAAIVAAAGAFSFQYWESHLQEPTRKAIRELAKNKAIVAVLTLIFTAYVGVLLPDLVERIVRLNPTSAPTKIITTSPTPVQSPTPMPVSTPTEERVFTDRTPGELLALFEGRTQFQAAKLVEPYAGKWMRVRGSLNQVMPNGPPGASTVIIMSNGKIIYCNTGPQSSERLMKMGRDDEIGLLGKISPYQSGGPFYLSDCELI